MLGACLFGVRAADDFRAYSAVSIRVLGVIRTGSGAGAYHIRWPAGRGTCQSVSHCTPSYTVAVLHSRSLLSREALEQHLGVAVDAQVLDRLGVRRRAGRISLPRGGCAEGGAQRASEGLHRDNGAATKADLGGNGGMGWVRGVVVGRRRCAVKHFRTSARQRGNIQIPALRPFSLKIPL